MPGKVNILADFNSRVPISALGVFVDDEAFELTKVVPPTSTVFAALEERQRQYNARLKAKRCPQCNIAEDHKTMLLCDYCNETWHTSCADCSLGVAHQRYWYCPKCLYHIKEHNVRDLTLGSELLEFLEHNTATSEGEFERIMRASAFLKFKDGMLQM